MPAIYHKNLHVCRKLHCTFANLTIYIDFSILQYLKFIYVINFAISTL